MVQQVINIGSAANNGVGDPLRVGAEKINSNFTELYAKQVPPQTGNGGKVLTTDGSVLSWTVIPGLSAINAGTLVGNTLSNTVVSSSLTSVGTLSNLTVTSPIQGTIVGNAGTATKLQSPRKINGVNFDGSQDIVIPIYSVDAGSITGTTLGSSVVNSSLTSVGTLSSLTTSGNVVIGGNLTVNGTTTTVSNETVTNTETITGALVVNGTLSGAGVSTYLASPPAIGGTTASTIRGTTITATTGFTGNLTGNVTGNVTGTVTDGVVTTGSYADPAWITSISSSKVVGSVTAAAGLLTGATLNSTVVTSSLTSVGTLTGLTVTGSITANTNTNNQSYTTNGTGSVTITSGATGNINNMNIGGTTAAQGNFTTLAASSTVSGLGFSTYLASPPAIGGTAAAAGTFTALTGTSLTATGTIAINTTSNNQSYTTSGTATITMTSGGTGYIDNIAIGFTTASTGKFTTLVGTTSVLTSGTGGIGYSTGAGGSVVQGTSRTTSVTLNKPTGQITMISGSIPANTTQSFVLTNSCISSTDIVHVQHISAGTLGLYSITAAPGNGSATIYLRNNTGSATPTEAPQLQFVVVKAVTA
jgi:hypothetical protein